jgi:hypothetical protein
MVDLSGGFSIVPEQAACEWEIGNAVRRLFDLEPLTAVRPLTVQQGVGHAIGFHFRIGGPAGPAAAADHYLRSKDSTLCFLLAVGAKREGVERAVAGETAAVDVFERDRERFAGVPLEQRRLQEFALLFLGKGTYRAALERWLGDLGVAVGDFRDRLRSAPAAVRFLADIPNLDVLLTLRLARDQEHNRAVERNDIRDLDWLSVAIPYSNVVVSERYWGSKARATRLDEKYGTIVITDARDLPGQLAAAGCGQ